MTNGATKDPDAGAFSAQGGNGALPSTGSSPLAVTTGLAALTTNPLMIDLPAPPITTAQRVSEEIMEGDRLRAEGYFDAASARYREALLLAPDDPLLHFRIAVCELAQGRRDMGHQHLVQSVRADPEFVHGHEWLSQWYLEEGLVEQALEHSVRAYQLAPHDGSVAASQAYVLEASGELDAAWKLVHRLVECGYTTPKVAALYARMAPRRGQTAPALSLITRLLESGGKSPNGLAGLHFSAAALLDASGRYDEAFSHVARAHELKRCVFDSAAIERDVDAKIDYYTRPRLACLAKATYRSIRPVFVVGMPRSGTSLVEQILASHPAVHGAGELDLIKRVVLGAMDMLHGSDVRYPQCLDGLSIDSANGLAQLYLEPLASLNRRASMIVDKMPLNFMYLGLISLLLPNAAIIHCRRDPLDTCLSCYMTNFAAGNQFCGNLQCLGHFYRQYERLMSHWKQTLDIPIIEVQYERLVQDTPGETRRLLESLNLPWDEHCLHFYDTPRIVSTSSVEQVRRPIYHSSVDRWKNYERHLGPLRAALDSR